MQKVAIISMSEGPNWKNQLA